jgi:hypothetical protein
MLRTSVRSGRLSSQEDALRRGFGCVAVWRQRACPRRLGGEGVGAAVKWRFGTSVSDSSLTQLEVALRRRRHAGGAGGSFADRRRARDRFGGCGSLVSGPVWSLLCTPRVRMRFAAFGAPTPRRVALAFGPRGWDSTSRLLRCHAVTPVSLVTSEGVIRTPPGAAGRATSVAALVVGTLPLSRGTFGSPSRRRPLLRFRPGLGAASPGSPGAARLAGPGSCASVHDRRDAQARLRVAGAQ